MDIVKEQRERIEKHLDKQLDSCVSSFMNAFYHANLLINNPMLMDKLQLKKKEKVHIYSILLSLHQLGFSDFEGSQSFRHTERGAG